MHQNQRRQLHLKLRYLNKILEQDDNNKNDNYNFE